MLKWSELSVTNKIIAMIVAVFAFIVLIALLMLTTPDLGAILAGISVAAALCAILLDPASFNGKQRFRWKAMPTPSRALLLVAAAGIAGRSLLHLVTR